MSITPLQKVSLDGKTYTRFDEVTSKLEELLRLSPPEQVQRCKTPDEKDNGFVPTECLLYLVRASRGMPETLEFEQLYKLLLERVIQRLPRATTPTAMKLREQNFQDVVVDTFIEFLSRDRESYDDRLDYYEVRFESALSKLKLSTWKKETRRTSRHERLSDDETEEVAPEVEAAAAAAADRALPTIVLSEDCRFKLEAAIESLPLEERTVIHMMRLGFPLDSNDPGKETIRKALGKAIRTVRYIKDRAIEKLTAAMSEGGCL